MGWKKGTELESTDLTIKFNKFIIILQNNYQCYTQLYTEMASFPCVIYLLNF